MSEGLAYGMVWAGILLVGVPLSIGIGVAIWIVRGRRADREEGAR